MQKDLFNKEAKFLNIDILPPLNFLPKTRYISFF